jgi:hypothetical protein
MVFLPPLFHPSQLPLHFTPSSRYNAILLEPKSLAGLLGYVLEMLTKATGKNGEAQQIMQPNPSETTGTMDTGMDLRNNIHNYRSAVY